MNTTDQETLPSGERPLVTFALIAYNQERFISEAVKGAFSQTYSPLEVILSDDCSSDRTFKIMQEMADAYDGPHKIVLNRNVKNFGIGGHVNHIMDLVKGEYIVIAAGDDISLPNRVEHLASVFSETPGNTTVVYSDYEIINENNEIIGQFSSPESFEFISLTEMCQNHFTGLTGCSASWHRSVFDYFGKMNSEITFEDRVISFRGKLLGNIKHIPEPLMLYRKHNENTVSMFHSEEFEDRVRTLKGYLSVYQNNACDLSKYISDLPKPLNTAKCLRIIRSKIAKLKAYLDICSGELSGIIKGIAILSWYRGNIAQGIALVFKTIRTRAIVRKHSS